MLRLTPRYAALLLIWALGSSVHPLFGQEDPKPAPPPAKTAGTLKILRQKFDEHAEAVLGSAKDKKKAQEIADSLLKYDWSGVDIPKATSDYVGEKELALLNGKKIAWDYDGLPPSVRRTTTDAIWNDWLAPTLEAARGDLGDITNKRISAGKRMTSARVRFRVLAKVLYAVLGDMSYRLREVAKKDQERLHEILRPAWKDFRLDTVMKSALYEYLPLGVYFRYAAWVGDPHVFDQIKYMFKQYLEKPHPSYEGPLVETALALGTFVTDKMGFEAEKERIELIKSLLTEGAIPDSVRSILRDSK